MVEIWPTMFGTLLLAIASRWVCRSRGSRASGKFTEFWIVLSSRYQRNWSAAIRAQFCSASLVEAPRCGRVTTRGRLFSVGVGKSQT